MRFDVLIPARGGSKGIPNKNIMDIMGFPLIFYSIRVCQECKNIGDIYISTESEKIIEVVKNYGKSK